MRRVEWIGAITPLSDETVAYRKSIGMYTQQEEFLLEAVSEMVSPLCRNYGATQRIKGQIDGYERTYVWGPKNFICEMSDIDADRLFKNDPDEAEFRDLENPEHDDREAVVPWMYVNATLGRILSESKNGPQLIKVGDFAVSNPSQIDRVLSRVSDMQEEAKEQRLRRRR